MKRRRIAKTLRANLYSYLGLREDVYLPVDIVQGDDSPPTVYGHAPKGESDTIFICTTVGVEHADDLPRTEAAAAEAKRHDKINTQHIVVGEWWLRERGLLGALDG